MATKRTTTTRKTTATRSSTARKPTARSRKTQSPPIRINMRPEHQREIFALTLIGLAVITIFLYVSGASGWLAEGWVQLTQRLLGWGSLLVPLALGLLGVTILLREQRDDLKLTGATVLGTLLLITALQVLLESAMGVRQDAADRLGEGGGIFGYALLSAIAGLIGRSAAFIGFCFVGLIGVMLTFDITLYELVTGMRDSLARFWAIVWTGSPSRRATRQNTSTTPKPISRNEPLPFEPPPGIDSDEDQMSTPIAARPTRASLFNRPETKAKASTAPAAPTPVAPKPATAKASTDAMLSSLLNTPAAKPSAASTPVPAPDETVQETLDGFDVPVLHRAWALPSIDMLDTYKEATVNDEEKRVKARLIEETLQSFKVEAQVVGVNPGPAVTQFELQPAVGVKVSKITTLEKDLALALAAPSIRIEAPIPGKAVVGIEIPNSTISVVSMREVMDGDDFDKAKSKLKLPLGKDVSGSAVVAGMERMPHLLVAGSTGSGKSVAVNGFVCALLLKHSPEELKFIMVDPKMVELIVYNSVPHLLSPVVTELERVVPTLKWATREMERRYKIFAKHGFRNIDSYKQAARRRPDLEPMPYIVIIIDELADLMMMAPDEVETLICRLAQMARATGMHLIIATQRPSVDVVTGLIKANFPSRIAFAVTSQIDSRVILDMNGAEQLLGRGDMLYLGNEASKPVRIQGTYVSDVEVERIVTFWRNAKPPEDVTPSGTTVGADGRDAAKPGLGAQPSNGTAETQNAKPRAQSSALKGPAEFLSVDDQDELLPAAIKLVQQHTRASASLLQRRMRIGYSKAAQLIDLLEQQGYVGPAEDGRSREVLKDD